MKLRPRTKKPTGDSSTMTATVPTLPPDMARLQTPPISELSNAGSPTARKEYLSDLSSSSVDDISDVEEATDSMYPTEDRSRPKAVVPAAPLTRNNLERFQDEITSAAESASENEDEVSPSTPTPSTRLVQARRFLLTESQDTYAGFKTRLELIDDYLHKMPQETRESHSSTYHEVKDLLRSHKINTIAAEDASGPLMSLAAEDDEDQANKGTDEPADPYEWTNKLDDLIDTVRQDPSTRTRSYTIAQIRELARPLNGGRLPSVGQAHRLINEQVMRENAPNLPPKRKRENKIEFQSIRTSESDLLKEKKRNEVSLDRRSGGQTHTKHGEDEGGAKTVQLGQGSMMPREVRDFNWERDCKKLDGNGKRPKRQRIEKEEGDDKSEDAQLLLAETPFLQMLMDEQIKSDLTSRDKTDTANIFEPWPGMKQAVIPIPYRFPLPRPTRERMEEAQELTKSLIPQSDLMTTAAAAAASEPGTVKENKIDMKRKWEVDEREEEDGGIDARVDDGKGARLDDDDDEEGDGDDDGTPSKRNGTPSKRKGDPSSPSPSFSSLSSSSIAEEEEEEGEEEEGSVVVMGEGDVKMSGALLDVDDDDDGDELHLYSDD